MSNPARIATSISTPAEPRQPGRPKDAGKRAAILDAAKRMFVQHGYDGVSMDQIATEAGVSKLTVYSHFGDKETLFGAAAKAYCEQQLPLSLFDAMPQVPLRERLLDIARNFFKMVSAPEAIAGHRILCTPQLVATSVSRSFWEAGPARVQQAFVTLLQERIAMGELQIDDPARAASQFFALLKGDPHAQLVFGCCNLDASAIDAHLQAGVDMFLRAHGVRGH